tara:strand:+ start:185 stop:679 length:495 start_codon:yes stop_codon:yes gene_type:complete
MSSDSHTKMSLNDMYNFIMNDFNNLSAQEQQYFNPDTFDVIEYYIYGRMTGALYNLLKTRENNLEIEEKTPQKTFYLGGHIKMSCDKSITESDINNVQKKINAVDMSLCWGMEIYSVYEHNNRFEQFKKFYYNYIEYINNTLYKPSGSKYLETMEHFNESIKKI